MTPEQLEQARKARNQYAREWRARNRDKVKANNVRYWARRGATEAKQEENDGGKNAKK